MKFTDYLPMILFILTGLFSLTAALFNFHWFFTHRRAQTFVSWFGRNGARIFYGILGIVLIICGILGCYVN